MARSPPEVGFRRAKTRGFWIEPTVIAGAVGFVDLGNIGKAMAIRLADRPAALWVYGIAFEPVAELREAGARVVQDVADLAGRVDLGCVMVRDDDQARAVLTDLLPAAREGLVMAVHSTKR